MNIFRSHANFACNFAIVVAPAPQGGDIRQQIDCSMLAPSAILNQAPDQTVTLFSLDHDCRTFCLAELKESFNATLPPTQFLTSRICLSLSATSHTRPL